MNAPLRQAERLGRLTTALGPDTLSLLRFDGSEHINELYEYRVEALAIRSDLDFDALIGTHATVEIDTREGTRHFDGIVTQARWAGVGENGHRYDLILRPWFWLASRRRNQRIFHNKTVVQILTELLSDYAGLGDPALEMKLSGDYQSLEYTVQYRESDLDFARRQMERAGISFHFRHAMGSHTLVMTDDVLAHETVGARPFKSYDGHHQAEGEHFWDWAPERNITTGAIRLTDFNFKSPDAAMETDRLGDAVYAQGQIESFDYPGDYLAQSVGKLVAGLRTNQERGADRRNRAVGDCVSLGAGKRVTLSGDKVPGTGETYLCLSASHHFVSEAYGSGGQGSDGYSFTGSYTLMPDTAPMVPPRRTQVPVVHGPQTAMVVGEGEIDPDEYGRILVRFHWDLDGAYSMRCRVSQNWAGNGWGGMVIPRIGMEVVVEFLEGDPDKPLVTGCVYNGRNAVPYALPANKTVSTFKSDTHQGSGYNEFRFEDEQGREEVFMHAQKDHNTIIENDESHSIGHDRSKTVGNDQSEAIGHDKTISVGNDHRETIGNDMVYNVGRNQQENYGKDHIHRVGNIHKQSIYADHLYEAGRNFEGEVFGRYTLDVGETITNNTKLHTLMAWQKMQIKGPGGKITIDASGITLEAPTIWLKGNVIMGGTGGAQVPTLQMAAREGLPLCEECAKFDDEKA
ncbi:type VI secretion system Vgr family protein [Paracoccus lutimaris]|uniref:Type VI secretion system secreted protein VgrG n=1 Tax=Paracoccus lutimaris TaxID=1490030 RepID=A0A368Z483_9RHOB|nr:type VI secretion system tip protein TssI/VgrG [Paracoccus lutimaris]RCW86759.1 type VI secretion system secreted protein VgrG [Paracoccus lutimaris]